MDQAKTNQNKGKNTPDFDTSEKRILVVEDDRTHRNLMKKILRDCDFQTVTAENGFVALSKIDDGQHFDLVIMDWDMPELDGLETVKEIRKREVTGERAHMPVIAFTSNREPGDREKCLAAGMDAYLPKDVWLPKWRSTLIDNLQGLIAGNFELNDFSGDSSSQNPAQTQWSFDLDAFDEQALEQSAALLKDELAIAIDEYLEDAAAYIRDIEHGFKNSDLGKIAGGSHPLKSNSKGFGLTAVSKIAEVINKQARSDNIEVMENLLPQLQEAFRRAEKRLCETVKRIGY